LRARLASLNPGVLLLPATDIARADLFSTADPDARAARLATLPRPPGRASLQSAHHTDGITTFALQRQQPVPALALTLLLQALAEHCGARLLRLKGLVDVAEMPGQPALIHGVQHVFAPPEFLPRWPSADHSSRLVFITQGVPRYFPARLLEAIEAEVVEAMQGSADC
jgi:G3E family GTPase